MSDQFELEPVMSCDCCFRNDDGIASIVGSAITTVSLSFVIMFLCAALAYTAHKIGK